MFRCRHLSRSPKSCRGALSVARASGSRGGGWGASGLPRLRSRWPHPPPSSTSLASPPYTHPPARSEVTNTFGFRFSFDLKRDAAGSFIPPKGVLPATGACGAQGGACASPSSACLHARPPPPSPGARRSAGARSQHQLTRSPLAPPAARRATGDAGGGGDAAVRAPRQLAGSRVSSVKRLQRIEES